MVTLVTLGTIVPEASQKESDHCELFLKRVTIQTNLFLHLNFCTSIYVEIFMPQREYIH